MAYQPIIYYSALLYGEGEEPVFGEYDPESGEDFSCLYYFGGFPEEAESLNIVWYDLECRKAFSFFLGLKDMGNLDEIFAMPVMGGAICLWLVKGKATGAIYEFNCEEYFLENPDAEWWSEVEEAQRDYDLHREKLSKDCAENLEALKLISQKYQYRFSIMLTSSKEIELTGLDVTLSDGTVSRLKEEEFFKNGLRALPKRLSLTWESEGNEINTYFTFDFLKTFNIFREAYNGDYKKNMDFLIHINEDFNVYEAGLFSQGMQAPMVIPADALQTIVFKNKFEEFRSANYKEPPGAWDW